MPVRTAAMEAVSSYALRRLAGAARVSVHSSYRRTVNLLTDGGLVALQAAGSPRSPLSVILPADEALMEALADAARASVSVTPEGGVVTPLAVFVPGPSTDIYSAAVPAADRARVPGLIRLAEAVLHRAGSRGLAAALDPGLTDPVTQAFRQILAETQASLRDGRPEEAARHLLRLAGLGGGLTPAGDDFLCGAAAALTALRLTQTPFGAALLTGFPGAAARTNDISAAFLACAAEGQASEAVTRFFAPAQTRTEEDLTGLFLAIGHSSGTDSLCGIRAVLSYNKEEWI